MATKRKAISKTLRFEVFKRDSFTCQYCGSMAPDVVLEVDHIDPVSSGGDNGIMNLVTSCHDCNRGKGAKKLSDDQVVKKQQEQLKELNEKREQLRMMLEWKNELSNLVSDQVDACESLLGERGRTFSESGRQGFAKWIKKYGFNEVYNAFEISLEQYAVNGKQDSFVKAMEYTPRIVETRRRQEKDPLVKDRNYIMAILKNNGIMYNEKRAWKMLMNICVTPELCEEVKLLAMSNYNWSEFWEEINTTFEGGW